MKIDIREYLDTDEKELIALTEELQDFLAEIDPLKRLIRVPSYGSWYTSRCIEEVRNNAGRIFVAISEEKPVGYIAGVIDRESPDMGLGYIETKAGRITELIVTHSARSLGVGARLMMELESFFRQAGCNIIRVEVFAPNEEAVRFYNKLNYSARTHDLIKTLT